MNYKHQDIAEAASVLAERVNVSDDPRSVLRSPEIRELYAKLGQLPAEDRAGYGQELNQLKSELEQAIANKEQTGSAEVSPVDVTAAFDVNVPKNKRPQLLSTESGSRHPLMSELDRVLDIFGRMGFTTMEARQLDDDWHMFTALNFPEGHPARDDYDTFITNETDSKGQPLVAPAHVSTMQNRLQKLYGANLEQGKPVGVVYTGRTFRNEDVDVRHEHTFYQVEISYIDRRINVGNLLATFKTFLEEYYQQAIEIKSQPFYFPFTEPSFELALSCPFCQKQGCHICGGGWIELIGMGMIHPKVLEMGGIDPTVYTGFAGGMGLDRLVMMKHNIEDVRHFESGRLEFLRQFS